ncbi:MAG: DUF4160 domain-containing protein [Acidobacteriota bacterium]
MFYGIVIQMFWNDHPPPHFHVRYAEFKGKFEIEFLRRISSDLPANAERLVMEWAQLHKTELLASWNQCRSGVIPSKIPGLL